MQQIKIQTFTWPDRQSPYIADKKYQVFVDGRPMYFTNRKHVKAWLAALNRHLNLNMHALNRLFAEVYTEYRTYYFHLKSMDRQRLANSFATIDKMFTLTLSRSSFQSGISLVLEFLRKICRYLLEVVEILEKQPMNRLATMQRYRLRTLQSAILSVEKELSNLPAENEK